MTASSANFAPAEQVAHLWDGCTDSLVACMAGAGNIASFWVEFDFGKNYNLTTAQLFGDADGNWVSQSWQLQYKLNATDPWITAFSNVNAFMDGWSTQSLSVTARYAHVEVFGSTVPATEARDLQI